MKRLVVCKFGGSSLADAARFRRVAEILRRNPARKYIVVSAPGARFPGDTRIDGSTFAGAAVPGLGPGTGMGPGVRPVPGNRPGPGPGRAGGGPGEGPRRPGNGPGRRRQPGGMALRKAAGGVSEAALCGRGGGDPLPKRRAGSSGQLCPFAKAAPGGGGAAGVLRGGGGRQRGRVSPGWIGHYRGMGGGGAAGGRLRKLDGRGRLFQRGPRPGNRRTAHCGPFPGTGGENLPGGGGGAPLGRASPRPLRRGSPFL